jgi:IMP dehydrogenase
MAEHSAYHLELSLCFDDVLMSPRFSTIQSRKDVNLAVNIGTNGRNLLLKTPLISSPMDTVSMSLMCIKMAMNGGLGILHRYQSIESQVAELKKVKRYLQYIIGNPYTLAPSNTLAYVREMKNELKITTFCIVDDTGKLLGLLTNRDLEYSSLVGEDALVSNCMNLRRNLQVITMDETAYAEISNKRDHEKLEALIANAKSLMLKYKVEKIPIINPDDKLLGLITYKNVKHYENNANMACLDTAGMLACGAAIGIVGDWWTRLAALVGNGVDCICIDVASGHNSNLGDAIDAVREAYPDLVLIVGNVCTAEGFKYLAHKDVDCIRVGIGNGSICSTRGKTGVGRGQFTSILDCFAAKISGAFQSNIISDGGSMNSVGNKAKAIFAGAALLMLGRTLAATEESPSMIIYKDGQKFKYTRGMASTSANISKLELCDGASKLTEETYKKHSEGVDGYTPLSGSVKDVIDEIVAGLKSSFSYMGCASIEEAHELQANQKIVFNLITSLGMGETKTRLMKL